MEYFLSGHGGSNTGKMYTLPVDLVTFCAMGTALDIPTSWTIFDALCSGDQATLGPLVHTRYGKGSSVAEITLYPTNDFTSGVFKYGGGKIPINSLNSGQFTLKDFCLMHRSATVVYWIACLS